MLITTTQKKAIDHYYQELAAYHAHHVTHETAVRSAFQNLLAAFAQSANWILIPEQILSNGKRPDGTLRDTFNLPRGYWEAKDTKDDLSTEIRKKINAGYPVSNTIFEDTRHAILYQNNKPVHEADITQPKDLTHVLDLFFHYAAPDIETFEHAVEDFKESIPDLALGLLKRIKEEHAYNKGFVAAFSSFLELCRTSLDPNMSRDTVNEMLVQHLLTERLFRTIFNNPDFTRRNVVAAEIEKVIQTLTSRTFNRSDFEKSTNRFYVAIENAAKNLADWIEKQHFLNTVYERFFQGYSVKRADTYGIVYTPQEIVDFMCASVEEVLQREFGTSIAEPGVQIIDPCVGTGSYIVNLLHRLPNSRLKYKYAHDLFCNEIMLLPYYIASLNIEHEYYSRIGEYKSFEGICFADTLELAESEQMSMFVEENTERIQREKDAQIMVVIGNPPYNAKQENANDNNQNRRYPVVDKRIRETYAKDSKASSKIALSDPYVKFFRWATDRLQGRDGIVCFVSNNGFFNGIASDGFRKHLLQDFNLVYHFDFKGDARTSGERRRTEGGNIFADKIREGVGITLLVRASHLQERNVYYHSVGDYWRARQKRQYLSSFKDVTVVPWQQLIVDEHHNWLLQSLPAEFSSFFPIGTKEAKLERVIDVQTLFRSYGAGVKTSRDVWAYDFDKNELMRKIRLLIDTYNSEVDRWRRRGSNDVSVDNFVNYGDTRIKWSEGLKANLERNQYAEFTESKLRRSMYRPFGKRWVFFDRILNERVYQFPSFFPVSEAGLDNYVIGINGIGGTKPFHCFVTDCIMDLNFYSDPVQCFPYYTYKENGSDRCENITDWALSQFQGKYGSEVAKWDIFHYVYAILHHPQYRERYAENLRRDLPHIPLLHRKEAFQDCVRIGRQLMDVHLHYEQAKEYPLKWIENRDVPFSWRVEKMHLSRDRTDLIVNESLTLVGIPQECFQYLLGTHSTLEWVIEQYQVKKDRRSEMVSDPNNLDDEEYIVRLVGKVITVSVETVRLVNELSQAVKIEDWMREYVEEN